MENIRIATLSLCVSRRMRWRTAHVFRDVEQKVSKYLITISLVNIGVGIVVSVLMAVIGMPSPILWGAMAAVLNYIPYVGQGVMILVLLAVGLGTQTELTAILLPVACYVSINFVEGQIVTPHFIGRTMTLNPFMIFLSITFWLWAWGPVGGLVAVPTLVLVGANDQPFLAATDYMANKIPGARKVVIPDAGHAANLDQPEAFDAAVLDFLGNLE